MIYIYLCIDMSYIYIYMYIYTYIYIYLCTEVWQPLLTNFLGILYIHIIYMQIIDMYYPLYTHYIYANNGYVLYV